MAARLRGTPSPFPGPPIRLEDLPARPSVQRWARALVRELRPLVGRLPGGRRRLLLLFLDGIGGSTLRRAAGEGHLPFLSRLRDHPRFREARAFSGMPSTTTAFQAGLFYGLRHPDIPAFSWFDRKEGAGVRMNAPAHAARIEARLREQAGAGLLEGGSSYIALLSGGARNTASSAALGSRFAERRLPLPAAADLPSYLWMLPGTGLRLGRRLFLETLPFLWSSGRFSRWAGSTRHEANFLLNHLALGTFFQEVAKSQLILDLVRGVPRLFHCIHDFDEVSHRRGPREAWRTLRHIDRQLEAIAAVAAASPNPPDIWVITDHGQIPSIPFERLFGCTLAAWLEGAGDEDRPLPAEVARQLGGSPGEATARPSTVVSCGNYAHVYLGAGEPLDAAEIHRRHHRILARALACPGVGLVALRGPDGGAMAFSGGRRVDPGDPATVPRGCNPLAARALLEELARSPSAGDLLLYGTWIDDACVAFSWEYSSHGGPSPEETETFVIHPSWVPVDGWGISHGADLHQLLTLFYGSPNLEARLDDARGSP